MTINISTEDKIIDAAKKVFLQQGYSGARMQDIADAAGINKALLHYYFRNKDKLFELIFLQCTQKMIPTINSVFDSDEDIFNKIRQFVSTYIEMLSANPYLPMFIANELSKNPEKVIKMIMTKEGDRPHFNKFIKDIQSAIEQNIIEPIQTVSLFINIMSLCIFPYIAKPMMQFFLKLDELEYRMILEQRKQEVADFIINSIKK